MNTNSVRSITMTGIHQHQMIELQLKPGLNIVHGPNGAGKTTLLHVLANLFEGDIERFLYINFEAIVIQMESGTEFRLEQQTEHMREVRFFIDGEFQQSHGQSALTDMERPPTSVLPALRDKLGARPVYVPAFRSILEAVISSRSYLGSQESRSEEVERIRRKEIDIAELEKRRPRRKIYPLDPHENTAKKTTMCREWFGKFVPVIRYPSLLEIRRELAEEAAQANHELSKIDQDTLISVLKEVLEIVSRGYSPRSANEQTSPSDLIARIQKVDPESFRVPELQTAMAQLLQRKAPKDAYAQKVYNGVLNVYANSLETRESLVEDAFRNLTVFQESVNSFLEGKLLAVKTKPRPGQRLGGVRLILDEDREAELGVLSSGERHVLSLLFSATHMSAADGIFLIDEPELSFHVDWQRKIMAELMKQAGDRQIIACTHAPEIGLDHDGCLVELEAKAWQSQLALDLDSEIQVEE